MKRNTALLGSSVIIAGALIFGWSLSATAERRTPPPADMCGPGTILVTIDGGTQCMPDGKPIETMPPVVIETPEPTITPEPESSPTIKPIPVTPTIEPNSPETCVP